MIQPVSFPTAKLLKEKGFNLPTREFWYKEKSNSKEYCTTGIEYDSDRDCIWDWNNNSGNGIASPYPNKKYKYQCSAPTIAEVVMWLYEKYDIWTVVNISIDGTWYFELFNLKDKRNAEIEIPYEIAGYHNSPTEAYEAAIEYTLENLI
jgi:hypothetical protein